MPGAPSLPTTTASVPLAPEPETGTDEAEPSDTSGIRAGAPGRPEQAVPSGPGSGRAAGGPTSLAPAGPASIAVTASVVRVLAPVGLTVGYAGRRYRGAMVFSGSPSGMTITTEVDVEDYLRGMGEIRDPRWPAASLRAQAIAARTFALDTMAKAGEVCPTQRCQVYLGAQVEYPEMDAAVRATAGQVLTHEGRLILAFYSASGGGSIATPEEAFGGTAEGHPYLRAGGYLTGDVQRWEVRVGLADLAARLGYPGRPDGVRVAKVGPSGRPLEITMWGASGERSWPATTVDRILGLRSNLFTISLEEAATAPAPLPGEPLTGELAVSAQRALLTGSSTTTTPTAPSTTRADTGQAGTTVQPAGQAATASSAGQAVTASSTGQPSVQPAAGPSTTASSTGGGDGTVTRSAAGIVVSGPVLSALATLALLGAAAWIARRWRLD
jgi:SpoIID/LytB domain protein